VLGADTDTAVAEVVLGAVGVEVSPQLASNATSAIGTTLVAIFRIVIMTNNVSSVPNIGPWHAPGGREPVCFRPPIIPEVCVETARRSDVPSEHVTAAVPASGHTPPPACATIPSSLAVRGRRSEAVVPNVESPLC